MGTSTFLQVLIYELRKQDRCSANEAAVHLLTRACPLHTLSSPKDLHTARPQDGAAPSISALTTLAQGGRLCPLHANLELPMNTSKPWILRFFGAPIHTFTIVLK